jgi:hypothetical protein
MRSRTPIPSTDERLIDPAQTTWERSRNIIRSTEVRDPRSACDGAARGYQLPHLSVEFCDVTIQHIDALQGALREPSVMGRSWPRQSQCERRWFPPSSAHSQGGLGARGTRTDNQSCKHATPTASAAIRDDRRQFHGVVLQDRMPPACGVSPGLEKGDPCPGQIAEGPENGGRHTAGLHEAMREEYSDPRRVRSLGLLAGALASLLRMAHEDLNYPGEPAIHGCPREPRAPERHDGAACSDEPIAERQERAVRGAKLTARKRALSIGTAPPSTGHQGSSMHIDTTTNRVDHGHGRHLLGTLRATTRQDEGVLASGTLIPPVIEQPGLGGVP